MNKKAWNKIGRITIFSIVILFILIMSFVVADDWPMFRHDINHTDYSGDSVNPTDFGILWKYETGDDVASSPSIVGDIIYFGSYDNNIYALNTSTGNQIWNYTTGDDIESSPAVVNNIVYIGSEDHHLYALNATNGSHIWDYATGDRITSSPAVVNNIVYIGSSDAKIYALNATNGSNIWDYTTEGTVASSPAVVNNIVYIGSEDNRTYALNATNGTQIWNKTLVAGFIGSITDSPIFLENKIYLSTIQGNLYSLNATNGTQIWNFSADALSGIISPTIVDGIMYFGMNNLIYALNATNGTQIWNFSADALSGIISGGNSIASSENFLFISAHNDETFYILNRTNGSLISQHLLDPVSGLPKSSSFISSPSISGGVVYIGSKNGYLYAFTNNTIPTITLNTPSADYVNDSASTITLDFNCSVTDGDNLKNISLYLTDPSNSSFSLNQTTDITGISNETNWTMTLPIGNYTWNCLSYDDDGNSDWGDSNRSIILNYTATCTDSDSDGFGSANINFCTYTHATDCDDSDANILPPYDDISITADTTLCSGTYYINDTNNDGIIIFNSNHTTLTCNGTILIGNTTGRGIYSSGNNNITIKNCEVRNYNNNLELDETSNSLIENNTIFNAAGYGILTNIGAPNCDNLTIISNNFTGNPYGIVLMDTKKSNMSYNYFYNNTIADLYLIAYSRNSTENIISYNNFIGTSPDGIVIYANGGYYTKNTTIFNNNVSDVTGMAIYLYPNATNNLIYNNIFSSTTPAYDNGTSNLWNTTEQTATNIIGGSDTGGNYYSDYGGADTDGDGIGETTYTINGTAGNIDYLPLANTVCGNSLIEGIEACDDGASNGVACSPACGSTCTYCSATCTSTTVTGGSCGSCFLAGTKILMADKTEKNIEEVVVGDFVKNYNFEKNKTESKKVIKIMSPIHNDMVEFVFEDKTKTTHTFDHPYYVFGKGWASYKPEWTKERYKLNTFQIEEEDYVMNKNGEKIKLVNINEKNLGNVQTYNFHIQEEILNNQNFFADNILVHNKPTPCTDTCSSLGYECGDYTICGSSKNCGTCDTGYTCSSGQCVEEEKECAIPGKIEKDCLDKNTIRLKECSAEGLWQEMGQENCGDEELCFGGICYDKEECKEYSWYNNLETSAKVCNSGTFCGDYVDFGIELFLTESACQLSLQNCEDLWWFDNSKDSCSYSQFCEGSSWWGLRTFETEENCKNNLPKECESEEVCGYWGECVDEIKERKCWKVYDCEGKPNEEFIKTKSCLTGIEIDYFQERDNLLIAKNEGVGFGVVVTDIENIAEISVKWKIKKRNSEGYEIQNLASDYDNLASEEGSENLQELAFGEETLQEDLGVGKLLSEFDFDFEEDVLLQAFVYANGEIEMIEWNIDVDDELEEECEPDWTCTWSDCVGGDDFSYAENCIDENGCGKNIDIPSPKECECYVDWDCPDWGLSECEIKYDAEEAIMEYGVIKGEQERICDNLNDCGNEKDVQFQECDVSIALEINETFWCFENCLELFNAETGEFIGRIKEPANSESDLTTIDLSFSEDGTKEECPYCFRETFDEETFDIANWITWKNNGERTSSSIEDGQYKVSAYSEGDYKYWWRLNQDGEDAAASRYIQRNNTWEGLFLKQSVLDDFKTEIDFEDLEQQGHGAWRFVTVFQDNHKAMRVEIAKTPYYGTLAHVFFKQSVAPEVTHFQDLSRTEKDGKLTIERKEDNLIFYINDIEIHKMEFDYLPRVGRIGFAPDTQFEGSEASVSVNEFSVYEGGCYDDVCGDGIIGRYDQCDDGNLIDGDGCSSTCKGEPMPGQCSDGIDNDEDGTTDMEDYSCQNSEDNEFDPKPACSDGIDNDGDEFFDLGDDIGCSNFTDNNETDEIIALCGDGNFDESIGEQCDDGNLENLDGCDSECLTENYCFVSTFNQADGQYFNSKRGGNNPTTNGWWLWSYSAPKNIFEDGKYKIDLHGSDGKFEGSFEQYGREGLKGLRKNNREEWNQIMQAAYRVDGLQATNAHWLKDDFEIEFAFSNFSDYGERKNYKPSVKFTIRFKDNSKYVRATMHMYQTGFQIYHTKDLSGKVNNGGTKIEDSSAYHVMNIKRQGNKLIYTLDGEEIYETEFKYLPEIGQPLIWMDTQFKNVNGKVDFEYFVVKEGCYNSFCGDNILTKLASHHNEECDNSEDEACSSECKLLPTDGQCNDGIDNDGDSTCDYDGCEIDGVKLAKDYSCENVEDRDEKNPLAVCEDEEDNDEDFQSDLYDGGCENSQDMTEEGGDCVDDTCIAISVCGNDRLDPDEQCEDGNKEDGDGCSSKCMIEETFPLPPGDSGGSSNYEGVIEKIFDLIPFVKKAAIMEQITDYEEPAPIKGLEEEKEKKNYWWIIIPVVLIGGFFTIVILRRRAIFKFVNSHEVGKKKEIEIKRTLKKLFDI